MNIKLAERLGCLRHLLTSGLLTLFLFPSDSSQADLIFWNGGDGVWDNSDANWSPSDEPDPDDDVIIGGNSNVTLGSHNAVESLAILTGASLRTEHYGLSVADQVTVNGLLQVAANSLSATLPLVSLTTSEVQITSGGELRMANTIEIDDPNGVGQFVNAGTLYGNNHLHFADQFNGTSDVFVNHGVLTVGNVTNSLVPFPGAPPARTLHLTAADPGARFDLDGNGSGVVNVGRNATLNVDGTVTSFQGAINLGHNSTLDISNGWFLGELLQGPATLTVDNGFVSGGVLGQDIPADVATIKGGQVIMDHLDSVINMVDDDGALTFDAGLLATFGTIQHRGTLTFNAPAQIGSGVDVLNTFNSHLVVNSDVSIDDHDWDWDSTGSASSITINAGGSLNTNFLSPTADDLWSANLYINGGSLNVHTFDGSWGQNAGTITIGGGGAGSTISGSVVFVQTNGSLHVEPDAFLDFNTQSIWSNGTLEVNGLAFLNDKVTWAGSTVHGDGLLVPTEEVKVSANTTIGVDRYVMNQANTLVEPGVVFTVDVVGIDGFPGGNDVLDFQEVTVNSGVLDLTVDSGKWRLGGTSSTSAGILNLVNSGGGPPQLLGSTLRTEGTGQIRISGDTQIIAPLELGAGVNGAPATGLDIQGIGGTVTFLTGGLTLDGGSLRDSIDRSLFNSNVNLLTPLLVTGDSTVDVEVFDWDGGPTTVTPSGTLRMLSGESRASGRNAMTLSSPSIAATPWSTSAITIPGPWQACCISTMSPMTNPFYRVTMCKLAMTARCRRRWSTWEVQGCPKSPRP